MPPTNKLLVPGTTESLVLPLFHEPLNPQTNQVPTEEVQVTRQLTVKKLRDILKDYSLPVSGNRDALLDRLRHFSQAKETWISQYRAAPGRQRGDISSLRSAKTETARVIEQQFGARVKASTYQPKRVGRAKELRDPPPLGDAVITSFDTWASGVNKQVGEGVPLVASGVQVLESPGAGAGSLTVASKPTSEAGVVPAPNKGPSSSMLAVRQIENRVSSITQMLGTMQTQLEVISSAVIAPSAQTSSRDVLPPTSCLPDLPCTGVFAPAHTPVAPAGTSATAGFDISNLYDGVHPDAQAPRPLPQRRAAVGLCYTTLVPPVTESEIPLDDLRICDLLGEPFPFDRRKVPDPPAVNFSDNLSQLFREWYQSSLLIVNGHGIPIRHWPWFYKEKRNIRTNVWGVIRMKWTIWKVRRHALGAVRSSTLTFSPISAALALPQFLVREFEHHGTEEAFWRAHSDSDGNRHNYKRICNDLKTGRKKDNRRDADAALNYFGHDLSHPDALGYFTYKRSGKTLIMTKPEKIGSQWRQLLDEHPEIAEAWAATQPQSLQSDRKDPDRKDPDRKDPELEMETWNEDIDLSGL